MDDTCSNNAKDVNMTNCCVARYAVLHTQEEVKAVLTADSRQGTKVGGETLRSLPISFVLGRTLRQRAGLQLGQPSPAPSSHLACPTHRCTALRCPAFFLLTPYSPVNQH